MNSLCRGSLDMGVGMKLPIIIMYSVSVFSW